MELTTIDSFMTTGVRSIGVDRPLAEAHTMMNEHGIRHLLVLDGGRVVGLLSQRDLHLIETLHDVDPGTVEVSEAMSEDVLSVEAGAPLRDVVHDMLERHVGSALVIRGGKPEGIFTTTDALRALEQLTTRGRKERRKP